MVSMFSTLPRGLGTGVTFTPGTLSLRILETDEASIIQPPVGAAVPNVICWASATVNVGKPKIQKKTTPARDGIVIFFIFLSLLLDARVSNDLKKPGHGIGPVIS